MFNLGDEWRKIERVLRVASRPRSRDFSRMARVTAVGVIAIGLIGLIISFIFHEI